MLVKAVGDLLVQRLSGSQGAGGRVEGAFVALALGLGLFKVLSHYQCTIPYLS